MRMAAGFLAACLVISAAAQNPPKSQNPVMDAVRIALEQRAPILTAAAETMPPDKYGFKPTPAQEPFAEIVLHTATSNLRYCATLSGKPAPQVEKLEDTSPKEKLVDLLKQSFDFCKTSLADLQDASLSETVQFNANRSGTKAQMALTMVGGWADHYAQAAGYLRAVGLLPPTARPRPQ